MSPRAFLAAVLVAAAALTACEHDDVRTPIAISTITVLPHLNAAQTRGLTSVPWTTPSSAVIDDLMFVQVPAAGCPQLRGAVVTETPTDVTVQVFATVAHCSDDSAGAVSAPVRLSIPLGTRHLHHGPLSDGSGP